MNIVLTGYMASGKTTVGKKLSTILCREFVDTDLLVEEKNGMKIPDIFKEFGEEHFRNLETAAIKDVSKMDNLIIATGGGAVLRTENIEILRENGIVVNLETTPEVIRERLLGDTTRPLVKDADLSAILDRFEARKPFYDNCDYKIKINIEKDADAVTEEIISLVKEKL